MVLLVLTGSKNQASCKSKVQFILTGEKEESDIRTFPGITFQRGGIDSFVMTTRKSLGSLQYLRIWHDNTGVGVFASWFLGAVIIRDLQTGDKFQFANDRWLAVEYGDGEVSGETARVRENFLLCRKTNFIQFVTTLTNCKW